MLPSSARSQSATPSFDCSRARTASEHLICADDGLARLDASLNEAFRARRKDLDAAGGTALLAEQKRWLAEIVAQCRLPRGSDIAQEQRPAAISCLGERYRARIADLTPPTDALPPGERPAATIIQDRDERAGVYADKRMVLARIQSNLERVAAGEAPWPVPQDDARDPLEAIVDAYAHFVSGDIQAMDAALAGIGTLAASRREATPAESMYREEQTRYFAQLDQAARDPSALMRLLAGLREVDSQLFLEAAGAAFPNVVERTVFQGMASSMQARLNGTWLRLPCRTVLGRAAAFAAAAANLGKAGGPLLSCPVASGDFAEIEALARDPGSLKSNAPALAANTWRLTFGPAPAAPPLPWDRKTAVAFMGDNPNLAAPILEQAAAQDTVGKLDFALFLHAFRRASAARDAKIAKLLSEVAEVSLRTADEVQQGHFGGASPAYDGSDESLIPFIELASSSGAATTERSFYPIPCAILVARPELLRATLPQWASNRDNFIPQSGCAWGRGQVRGFPEAEFQAFLVAAEDADGHFLADFGGSLVHALRAGQRATAEAAKLDPKSFLEKPEPKLKYPYQTWGMASLNNHAVSLRLKPLYESLRAQLAAFYKHGGLTAREASRAAMTALFASVWGAECGGAVPAKSLRGLLLDHAPVDDIAAWIDSHGMEEAVEVTKCADYADIDSLLHIAVDHPRALALLLKRDHHVDERNNIGKTPLMVAAQFDEAESARLLVADKARVNTTTWQRVDDPSALTLYHDGRTALMYAAANASLRTIKLLLTAGADPCQADTKGSRAIDYLLGFGPVPANPKLTPDERAEAARLLF